MGQCVGPNICCGPSIGCYINTVESKVCEHENDSPIPCDVAAPQCGSQTSDGYCMADGVCCNDGEYIEYTLTPLRNLN